MSSKNSLGTGLLKEPPIERAVMKRPRAVMDEAGKPLDKNDGKRSKKGESHRNTTILKDAIIYACQLAGSDTKGKDGLVGYLYYLAVNEPKTMGALLGRALPYHVTSTKQVEVTYRSAEEVKAELEARGIIVDRLYH